MSGILSSGAPVDDEAPTAFSSLTSLLELSVNTILSRRDVIRDEPSVPTTSFGLDAPLYKKFRDQFWAAADHLFSRDVATSPFQLLVYVSATSNTPLQRKALLEEWQFHYAPLSSSDQPSSPADAAATMESHQLLRSVAAALPLLPANELRREYACKPNAFAFTNQVCLERDARSSFNTKELGGLALARVTLPGLGTLSLDVKYRKDCRSFSKPQDLVVTEAMDESYYPQSQVVQGAAGASAAPATVMESDLEFYSCVDESADAQVSATVEKAFQSCNKSEFLEEPASEPAILVESMTAPAGVQQFQQAMHDLQNLDMLTKCTATFSKNDLNTLMMR